MREVGYGLDGIKVSVLHGLMTVIPYLHLVISRCCQSVLNTGKYTSTYVRKIITQVAILIPVVYGFSGLHTRACMHICLYTCLHGNVHACTQAHACTHTHTHTHTHTAAAETDEQIAERREHDRACHPAKTDEQRAERLRQGARRVHSSGRDWQTKQLHRDWIGCSRCGVISNGD